MSVPITRTVTELRATVATWRKEGNKIAVVPTMGALHRGHLSLVHAALEKADRVIVTLFVNPRQFNNAADLAAYPRTEREDAAKLAPLGAHMLYAPGGEQIYPPGFATSISVGGVSEGLCGAHRPGHFAGMAQVVKRLLDIVGPDQLFMGQKDYQQAVIVRSMLEQLELGTKLVVCPIVREADGLAMSSRNRRLSKEQRAIAPAIYQALMNAKAKAGTNPPGTIKSEAVKQLNFPGMEPEYFEIVDGNTLQPISAFDGVDMAVACTAVRVGEVRLIDNMILINKN